MFYPHPAMIPHYMMPVYVPPPVKKPPKKKKKQKTTKISQSLYAAPYKKRRYSLAYYFKHVLWRRLRRLWSKRRCKNGARKKKKAPSVLSHKGNDEHIDLRDFWGSRYGSQWLFAKHNPRQRPIRRLQQQQQQHNRLVEIIDAFKSQDLRYLARHPTPAVQFRPPGASRPPSKCPCCRPQCAGRDGSSEWSASTPRRRRPRAADAGVDRPTPSWQHAYLHNWQDAGRGRTLPALDRLAESRMLLDRIRTRVEGGPGSRCSYSRRRGGGGSSCSESGSVYSTLSRRERAKILKRQMRAKEKASILWLLSKAFGGHVPSDLREPFYRDQENIRRLKPKIVHSLANAELYCLALVNMYSDPNYNNLDHQGIIQALTRKGICLVESKEAPLTETTLVQTAPIRLKAHMSVIDGIMCLFIKEVLIPEKIVEVCRKFSTIDVNSETPSTAEESAILWINKCCKALENEIRSGCSPEDVNKLPRIPVLKEMADISDGCCMAAVISYYCPAYLRWQDIVWNDPMSLGDSIHNLQLIRKFCCECLPREINFLSLEDLLYLHPSIRDNILAFISDLLFLFVITKVNCVTKKKDNVPKDSSHVPLESSKSLSNFPSHKTQAVCSPIPNLRSDSYGGSTSSLPDIRAGSRSKVYGSREKLVEKVLLKKSNISTEDLGVSQLQRTNSAGVVNGWKAQTSPYADSADSGSGSPRRGSSEASRPAVDGESASSNLSQPSNSIEDVNLARHHHFQKANMTNPNSPLREQIYGLRKNSEGFLHGCGDPGATNGDLKKGRKSLEEYYNQLTSMDGPLRSVSASNITENKAWRNMEKCSPRSHGGESVSGSSQSSGIGLSDLDSKHQFSTTSFAQLSKLRDNSSSSSINIVYMNQERNGFDKDKHHSPLKKLDGEGKKTTFAALPNTTTWKQQRAVSTSIPQTDSGHETPTEPADTLITAQLCNIKMRLEEQKRKIELKKKRMELLWKKQRQKLGKAAFLQAVSKGSNAEAGTPDSGTGKEVGEPEFQNPPSLPVITNSPFVKKMSVQEIADDLDNVQKKWLNRVDATDQLNLPDSTDGAGDIETLNIDLQTSIDDLTTSLTDLQADISRISLQQEHVESIMKDSIDDCSHFFLHSQSSNDHQFKSSPTRGPLQWKFDDTSLVLDQTNYSELNSMGLQSYLMSPQVQDSRSHQLSSQSSKLMSSYTSLPPCPAAVRAPVAEELYSQVIKHENRQKVPLNPRTSPQVKVMSSRPLEAPSLHSAKTVPPPRPSAEIHVVLPKVPDCKTNGSAASKKSKDVLYIPIEKEVKKSKSKPIKSVKAASDLSNVPKSVSGTKETPEDSSSFGFVIGADLVHPDPETETEMQRKKELIMNLSIQRKAEYERKRLQKEQEYARIKAEELRKQEYQAKKREEEKRRREEILEQYRQRKLREELEKEGGVLHKDIPGRLPPRHKPSLRPVKTRNDNRLSMNFTKPAAELKNQSTVLRKNGARRGSKPRPHSAYVPMNSDLSSLISLDNAANKRNSQIITGHDMPEFDLDSLNSGSTSASSHDRARSPTSSFPHHRNLHLPENSNPSSDGASDTASNGSSAAAGDYTGPKLFVKPTAKSNRGIIVNAINTVLAGAVNADTKRKVLEEINRSDSKHFLILFRDAGCQFRALYTYNPDREEVTKIFGIGPKSVTDKMMDRFYKYNSGGKCFSEIQTKHLTVTIDAFTLPNSVWAGKKLLLPKKEFF